MNLARTPMSESVDYAKLASASEGFTGADIANVCREVKMQALEANIKPGTESSSAVDTAMVLKVIKNTKPSAPVSVTGRYLTFLSEHGRE
jgi:SpoVK/Ycf46/Vps4 family AAA+-type ATPase